MIYIHSLRIHYTYIHTPTYTTFTTHTIYIHSLRIHYTYIHLHHYIHYIHYAYNIHTYTYIHYIHYTNTYIHYTYIHTRHSLHIHTRYIHTYTYIHHQYHKHVHTRHSLHVYIQFIHTYKNHYIHTGRLGDPAPWLEQALSVSCNLTRFKHVTSLGFCLIHIFYCKVHMYAYVQFLFSIFRVFMSTIIPLYFFSIT